MKAGNARTSFTHRISAVKGKTRSPLATAALDEIWRRAAARVGFQLARTGDAYATSDGQGGIAIGAADTLDDDDALAQLVFHELCHAVTEGETALRKPDWGLDNVPEHVEREHACLRVPGVSGRSLRPARGHGADDAVSRLLRLVAARSVAPRAGG